MLEIILIAVGWAVVMFLKVRHENIRRLQIQTRNKKYPNLNNPKLVGTPKYPW